ncbi:MAG: hypothetical protein OES38_22270 [Gammaproteobacteria bacterium]|nr:hypothetical protein [Gammaproteobacteria bacterium]
MKMDYQFLIGRDFSVGDDVYTVRDIAWSDDSALVQAHPKNDQMPLALPNVGNRQFPLTEVLQWLLVEEEIELFNPNFLGASGS